MAFAIRNLWIRRYRSLEAFEWSPHPGLNVLVGFADPERWTIATVKPLSDVEIRKHLSDKFGSAEKYDNADAETKELLSTPYFLNAILHGEMDSRHSRAQTLIQFFERHISGDAAVLDTAAGAAYEMYRQFASRTFPLAAFADIAGPEITKKLISEKALIVHGESAAFDHHLNHDILVSRFLKSDRARWTPDILDEVTFGASSFDVLAMTLQQLSNSDDADLFLRRVYDWSLAGAAYAITDGGYQSPISTSVSAEMQAVLLAMLSIRQWDIIEATRTKARDALSLYPRDMVERFLDADSVDVVLLWTYDRQSEKAWFQEWKSLFLATSDEEMTRFDIALIQNEDSLLGWTFANVQKRSSSLSPERRKALIDMLHDCGDIVRWRIVHVLGAFPTEENVHELLERLGDTYKWVRYGAMRSLVEIAACTTSDQLRKSVFAQIEEKIPALIGKADPIVKQLLSDLFVSPAPKDWLSAVMSLVARVYDYQPSLDQKQAVEELMYRLKGRYSAREDTAVV
ncbi:MAG TPA: hypothetical protein VGZ02_17550 [Candidatus Baltobacteraceae bacterium]|jgi:hypothetical protein|nr:hypothetical protein [Candidatus Baltobacteraceae bacterium]